MASDSLDRRPQALIVEDDGIIRMLAADMLEDWGFESLEADSMQEAMAILGEHGASIALLFTDVNLMGSDSGFELARKTALLWPHIGILVASGRRWPNKDEIPNQAHFVEKPFNAQVVYNRIKQLMPDHPMSEYSKD